MSYTEVLEEHDVTAEQWETLNTHDDPPHDLGAAWDLIMVPGSSEVRRKGSHTHRYCRVKGALMTRAMAKLGLSDLLDEL